MPLYMYHCPKCEKDYERFLGLYVPGILSCEVCKAKMILVTGKAPKKAVLRKKS